MRDLKGVAVWSLTLYLSQSIFDISYHGATIILQNATLTTTNDVFNSGLVVAIGECLLKASNVYQAGKIRPEKESSLELIADHNVMMPALIAAIIQEAG